MSSTTSSCATLRPSCESTNYINQGDLVLPPDMYPCETTPEPYIATVKLAPPFKQVFRNVPFDRLNFPSYSISGARKSILEKNQLELTEVPDVRRMDPETLKKLLNQFLHTLLLSIMQQQLPLTSLFQQKRHS